MDTVTHALTGAVIGYCGFRQRGGRVALTASILAAEFPDIDIVLLLANSETYLRWHRSVTHSVILSPLWAVILAFLIWEVTGRRNFRWLWWVSLAGVLSHLFLDWITNFGTMLLWPFSDSRFSLSWVFILDPYVWALLGVTLWAAIRTQRAAAAQAGLTILCGYFLFCCLSHARALEAAIRTANTEDVWAYAEPLNPLDWAIIEEHGSTVTWSGGGETKTFVQFRDTHLLPKAEATEAVKTFHWFAANPLVEKLTENGHIVLRYRDLRFRSALPWGGVREGMFVVAKVVFDAQGNVLASALTSEQEEN